MIIRLWVDDIPLKDGNSLDLEQTVTVNHISVLTPAAVMEAIASMSQVIVERLEKEVKL